MEIPTSRQCQSNARTINHNECRRCLTTVPEQATLIVLSIVYPRVKTAPTIAFLTIVNMRLFHVRPRHLAPLVHANYSCVQRHQAF
jgi:hypothetical protein